MEGNVLLIRRIRVRYRVRAPEEKRDAVERAHDLHRKHCPVARSLEGAIEIETSYELAGEDEGGAK